MELQRAIQILLASVGDAPRLATAFAVARANRAGWLIADPIGFADLAANSTPPTLPSAAEWRVEVDGVGKPKPNGGARRELLPDIFTGTLLQALAAKLVEQRPSPSTWPGTSASFTPGGADSYAAWAATVMGWVRAEIAQGRVVVLVDLADFFSSIQPLQICLALQRAGFDEDLVAASETLLAHLHFAARGEEGNTDSSGLAIIPDPIAWLLADRVLQPFDRDVRALPHTRNYIRWVDDCFLSVNGQAEADTAVTQLTELAERHGFRFNPAKSRRVASPADFNATFLSREHELLDELFAIAAVNPSIVDLDSNLQRLFTARASAGEFGRVVKRLYSLAMIARSPKLVERAEGDLAAWPAAERQIISYLARMGWPIGSHSVLMGGLQNPAYTSRQLLALRLIVSSRGEGVPPAAFAAIDQIASGRVAAPDFARVLAFAALAETPWNAPENIARFAKMLPGFQSAMARRVGLEWLIYLGTNQAPAFVNDPSPQVRHLAVAFAAGGDRGFHNERHLGLPAPPPGLTWGGADLSLVNRLRDEVH